MLDTFAKKVRQPLQFFSEKMVMGNLAATHSGIFLNPSNTMVMQLAALSGTYIQWTTVDAGLRRTLASQGLGKHWTQQRMSFRLRD